MADVGPLTHCCGVMQESPLQGDQACSGSDSEVEAEQMREGSRGESQRPSSGAAAAGAAPDTRQPDGLADAHRAAAETYRAALAALNTCPAAQDAPPPQAAPILGSEHCSPAVGGSMHGQPLNRQRLVSARHQSGVDSSAGGQGHRAAVGRNADAGLAARCKASHSAALQAYKDALRLAAGLPPETAAPSESKLPHAGWTRKSTRHCAKRES